MLMLEGSGKTEPFKSIQRAKTIAELHAAARACASHPHFTQPGGAFISGVLEPPPDLPESVHLPINAWRPVPTWWRPSTSGAPNGQRYKASKAKAMHAPRAPEGPSLAAPDAPVPALPPPSSAAAAVASAGVLRSRCEPACEPLALARREPSEQPSAPSTASIEAQGCSPSLETDSPPVVLPPSAESTTIAAAAVGEKRTFDHVAHEGQGE